MKDLTLEKCYQLTLISFFVAWLVIFGFWIYEEVYSKDTNVTKIEKIVTNDSLTLDNVYQELIKQEVKYPNIVICQVILETGYLKSYSCKVRNNLFGFYNGKRYLEFSNWKECIAFKKQWQDKKFKGGNYYTFLETLPYAEDQKYCNKLKHIKYEKGNKKCVHLVDLPLYKLLSLIIFLLVLIYFFKFNRITNFIILPFINYFKTFIIFIKFFYSLLFTKMFYIF